MRGYTGPHSTVYTKNQLNPPLPHFTGMNYYGNYSTPIYYSSGQTSRLVGVYHPLGTQATSTTYQSAQAPRTSAENERPFSRDVNISSSQPVYAKAPIPQIRIVPQAAPIYQHNQQTSTFFQPNLVQYHHGGPSYGFKRPVSISKRTTNFPYKPLPDKVDHKTFPIRANNLYCFHGFSSVFTLQHRDSFLVDGVNFNSVDHYYQMRKVKDLLGVESEQFYDGSTKNYGGLAKQLLSSAKVGRDKIDEWRVSAGVLAVQKALLEKLRQNKAARDALMQTGEKIIAHTYVGEDFYGVGVPINYLKSWSAGMEKNKTWLKIPMTFPLSPDSVQYVPTFGKGRNVLGVIYMILREKINREQLDSLSVDSAGQKQVNDASQQLESSLNLGHQTSNGASSAGQRKGTASQQPNQSAQILNAASTMEVDFMADDSSLDQPQTAHADSASFDQLLEDGDEIAPGTKALPNNGNTKIEIVVKRSTARKAL